MKKFLAFAVLPAMALIATPAAAADFTGPRVGAVIGTFGDDFGGFDGEFTYGLNAGYDFDLGRAVVGGTVEWQDSDNDLIGRDLSVTARAGGKAGQNVLIYALAGYTNLSVDAGTVDLDEDGFRLGAGVEVAIGDNFYVNVEERYSDYGNDVNGWQTALGAGFRF